MTYLKLNNVDFSHLVSGLTIKREPVYNAQSNAAGNTVVDFINDKKIIEVNFIPTDRKDSERLLEIIYNFQVVVEYLDPLSNNLEKINCIVPTSNISYYTIQDTVTKLKKFSIKFNEM